MRRASWSRRAHRSAYPGPGSHVATGSCAWAGASWSARSQIETMELAGHTDCGVGYRLRDPDVLIVGDYLSPIEYPFVYHSTAAYRSTLAGLADLLRRDPPALVVPGHGAPLEAAAALAIAEQDLGYLHALRTVVAHQVAEGADRETALEAAIAVPTPRSAPIDLAESRRNAERQFEELVAC